MTKSLAQLQKQIAALEQQAEAIKKKEVAGVIAKIKDAIAHYGLTAADLGLGGKIPKAKPGPKPKAAKRGKKAASKVKYRDDAGHTWSGHGRRPQWFVDAVASGKSLEQLSA